MNIYINVCELGIKKNGLKMQPWLQYMYVHIWNLSNMGSYLARNLPAQLKLNVKFPYSNPLLKISLS